MPISGSVTVNNTQPVPVTVPSNTSVVVTAVPPITVGNTSTNPLPVVQQERAPFMGQAHVVIPYNYTYGRASIVPMPTGPLVVEHVSGRCDAAEGATPTIARVRTYAGDVRTADAYGIFAINTYETYFSFDSVGLFETAASAYTWILKPTTLRIPHVMPNAYDKSIDVTIFRSGNGLVPVDCTVLIAGRYEPVPGGPLPR
jgi:hypothetical protein